MKSNVVPLERKAQSLDERSDDELMRLAACSVHEAFEDLVRRHARRVVGHFAKQTGDRDGAEELGQEIWLSVWGHRETYRPEGKFLAWLFTLVRNRLRTLRRDQTRRPRDLTDPAVIQRVPDLSPNELDRLLVAERRARVERALALAPENLREALVLRFTQELSYGAIAEILDTNESTARSRVFHGLRELRRRMKGDS